MNRARCSVRFRCCSDMVTPQVGWGLSEKIQKLRGRPWMDSRKASSPVPSAPSVLQAGGHQFWVPRIRPAERGEEIRARVLLLSGIRWCGHITLQDKVCLLAHMICPELSFSKWDPRAA